MADPVYTIFIRVPMPRGDFVDPPAVHWDTSKDVELWNVLSGAGEIDWPNLSHRRPLHLAVRFDATVPFLLQQVAYLTERHASQVRAQLRKGTAAAKGTGISTAPSPVPSGEPASVLPGHNRTISTLSQRREAPTSVPGAGAGASSATNHSNISRNTSATTLNQAKTAMARDSPGTPVSRPSKGLPPMKPSDLRSARQRFSSEHLSNSDVPEFSGLVESVPASDDDDDDDSQGDDSSSDDGATTQSRIISRPWNVPKAEPLLGGFRGSDDNGDDDDDDDEAVFKMPAEMAPSVQSGQRSLNPSDLGDTLRGHGLTNIRSAPEQQQTWSDSRSRSQTSDSSFGSVSIVARPKTAIRPHSPKSTLERTSRRTTDGKAKDTDAGKGKGKGKTQAKEDDSLSDTSSFSDLDDGSVTRSALEEYMGIKMQDGGKSSRFNFSAMQSRFRPS